MIVLAWAWGHLIIAPIALPPCYYEAQGDDLIMICPVDDMIDVWDSVPNEIA